MKKRKNNVGITLSELAYIRDILNDVKEKMTIERNLQIENALQIYRELYPEPDEVTEKIKEQVINDTFSTDEIDKMEYHIVKLNEIIEKRYKHRPKIIMNALADTIIVID